MATLRQVEEYLGPKTLLGMAEKVGMRRPVSCRELMGKVIAGAHEIKHVFVLMLENRSFDHMLGFAGIVGTGISGKLTTEANDLNGVAASNVFKGVKYSVEHSAEFKLSSPDPGHEFGDVVLQLCGESSKYPPGGPYPPINNSGFAASYAARCPLPGVVLQCFDPEQLPVLTALAREFALCDGWFSSMPGPTWPNRYFLHAASSGGLDDSLATPSEGLTETVDGYEFENGTIFKRLEAHSRKWIIFEGDEFPQVKSIAGLDETYFHDFAHFRKYVDDPSLVASYIFIEPNYGHDLLPYLEDDTIKPADYTCGTSQHPVDDVTAGEWLIKAVYDIIRNSPHWEHSILVITYDEHGGFYDHVAPPPAVAPGDVTVLNRFLNVHGFDFRQLGVRVPAVIISPLIPHNIIDHTTYDHSSVPATIAHLFGMEPLTERDRNANSFEHLLSLDLPRKDCPTSLPVPATSIYGCGDSPAVEISKMDEPMEARLRGFVYVAFIRHYKLAVPEEKPAVIAEYQSLRTNRDALEYMRKVRPMVRAQMNLPPIRTDVFVELGMRTADGKVPIVPSEDIKKN
jgi:phospholipase C